MTLDPQLQVSRRKRVPPEIERLHGLGFAVHWLRPKSKIPINRDWTKGPRLLLEGLRAQYTAGMNPGVRLGHASNLGDGYLAVLDLDVKSEEKRHRQEAREALYALFPETKTAPRLDSGRGNGSAHYYVKVKVPVRGEDVKARSTEKVKVLIGGKLEERPAWEVSLLSEGRQAALVGAVHPDTGKEYQWGRRLESIDQIPLIKQPTKREAKFVADELTTKGAVDNALRIDRNADVRKMNLRKDQVRAVTKGEGVSDRSAEVYSLCMAMLQRGVKESQILGVFTNPDYYLGRTAYDHAKTKNRQRAAQWVAKYCLAKAREKVDVAFDIEETEDDWSDDEDEDCDWEDDEGEKPRRGLVLPKGFEGVGGWEDHLELKSGGKSGPGEIRCTVANLLLILSKKAAIEEFLSYDLFAGKIRYACDTPWGNKKGQERSSGEEDALRCKDWIRDVYGIEPSVYMIDEAMNIIALRSSFHPVKQYLEGLEWDGVERVDNALRYYLGADMPEPYLSTISRLFFQALIQRIYEPGTKFDTVIVLEGKQGIGKSAFPRILVGDDWFLDELPNVKDKDAALNLQGIWACEFGELIQFTRGSNEAVKQFITRTTDKVRPPYGKRRVDHPRSTVFIASTDTYDYLTDPAGNRRWLPVRIKGLKFAELERDRDQLWAEAMFLYTFDKKSLWLTGDAKRQAEALQESRRVEDEGDLMKAKLNVWIEEQRSAKVDVSAVTIQKLFDDCFLSLQYTRSNTMRAGQVLRQFGYEKKHTKAGNVWVKRESF